MADESYGCRRFDGRVVLVTGAGQGIGAATCRRLAAEGAVVAVTDVDIERAQNVADGINDTHGSGRAMALHLDVTDDDSIASAVRRSVELRDRLDALVGCAGRQVLDEQGRDRAGWHRQLDLSLVGTARCITEALPHLEQSEGAVVAVSSVNALADFGSVEYAAAKAGLLAMVRTMAGTYGPRGVRVNAVVPGTVRTPVWQDPSHLDRLATLYPLGRVGEPEDLAAAIAFLAGPDAAWITGVALPVEGGVMTGFGRQFSALDSSD